ncbi:MAG: fructose-6-phosphate aldolase, partial [Leptotrichiaceae bacterium]|nr:fructose-6-phosphate aldolase [Leptotrichiaceae bacterium]
MIYMLDTANVEEIKKAINLYPIQAVTTNPSIIAKENRDFFEILKEIREVVGNDVTIHAQVIGKTAEEMISEAREIRKNVVGSLYIKIPATTQGIKAIRILSAENFNLTATAIITPQQALMAATAGAEFLAPYINRIDNICGDGVKVVEDIIRLLE